MEKVFKIHADEYGKFLNDFLNGKFGMQRLGQAFWNEYYGGNPYWQAFDPFELFYESDDVKALIKITNNHLK